MNAKASLPAVVGECLTMTSLEISGLAEKRHDNVVRDIKKMLVDLYGVRGQSFEQVVEDASDLRHLDKSVTWDVDARGYVTAFHLDKSHAVTLVAGYDAKLRKRIVDRWEELERATAAHPATLAPEVLAMIRRDDGISRMLAHKVTEQGKVQEEQSRALAVIGEAINALVAIVQPSVPGVVIRHGKTAGAILKSNGYTKCPMNFAKWFADRLEAGGCRVDGYMDTSVCRARLFDPDKAEAWLKNGGKAAVDMKLAERRGQGALALASAAHRVPALPTIPPDMREGMGLIFISGEPVFFDIRQTQVTPDDRFVVITVKGDVMVDIPACTMAGRGGTMGSRGVLTSPHMEAVLGRHDPIPVQWEGVILGKVIERQNVVRLPKSAG